MAGDQDVKPDKIMLKDIKNKKVDNKKRNTGVGNTKKATKKATRKNNKDKKPLANVKLELPSDSEEENLVTEIVKGRDDTDYEEGDYSVECVVAYDRSWDRFLVVWERPTWAFLTASWLPENELGCNEKMVEFRLKQDVIKEVVRRADWADKDFQPTMIDYKEAMKSEDHHEWKNLDWELKMNKLLAENGHAPVYVINMVDQKGPPNFEFIDKMRVTARCRRFLLRNLLEFDDPNDPHYCRCEQDCTDCRCATAEHGTATYREGRLFPIEERKHHMMKTDAYEVFECTTTCPCPPTCVNRLVQRGRTIPLAIVKDPKKAWALRSASRDVIPKGTFIVEYFGQMLTAGEYTSAAYGDDVTYQFRMPYQFPSGSQKDVLVVDSLHMGNEARFANHSCTPNMQVVRVYVEPFGVHVCRFAFFAKRDIEFGEELTFDYNPDNDVEQGAPCFCTENCPKQL